MGVTSQAWIAISIRLLLPHEPVAELPVTSIRLTLAKSGVLDRPFSLGSLAVESVVLMKSELTPTGSVYTKLWDVRLRG